MIVAEPGPNPELQNQGQAESGARQNAEDRESAPGLLVAMSIRENDSSRSDLIREKPAGDSLTFSRESLGDSAGLLVLAPEQTLDREALQALSAITTGAVVNGGPGGGESPSHGYQAADSGSATQSSTPQWASGLGSADANGRELDSRLRDRVGSDSPGELGTGLLGRGGVLRAGLPGPAAWDEPWQEAAADTAALLVSDSARASTGSEDQALGGLYGPLGGLLFTRALNLPPGFKRQPPTILLVESDEASRDALTVRLVEEGYLVLPAATGREALQLLRMPLAPIGVIVLDMNLPDISGPQLYQRLRELYPKLPAVVCTNVDPTEVAQLRELGVRHYLPKPIASEQVLATVQSLLS